MQKQTKYFNQVSPYCSQRGATLLVALILLAVVTIIGVGSMQSSTLEIKMVASSLERSRAFSIAESAMSRVESRLVNTIDDLRDLMQGQCMATSDKPCFAESCEGGYCFEGVYNNNMQHRIECRIEPEDGSQRRLFWQDAVVVNSQSDSGEVISQSGSVWDLGQYGEMTVKSQYSPELDDNGNPVTDGDGDVVLLEDEDVTVKFIVEFLCFTNASRDVDFSMGGDPDAGHPLFRVTVLLDEFQTHPIMLQSTYAFPI